MDRTISLNSEWYFYEGIKKPSVKGGLFKKTVTLPINSSDAFSVVRKIICPKQVNDTVTVYFDGDFSDMKVYAGKKLLNAFADENGNTVYDITAALKTGKTCLCATVSKGSINGFFLSVKRNYNV